MLTLAAFPSDPFVASAAETRQYLALPKRKKRKCFAYSFLRLFIANQRLRIGRDDESNAVSRLFCTPSASSTISDMDDTLGWAAKNAESGVEMGMEVD